MDLPPESPVHRPKKNRAGGIVVPHAPKWYQRLGAWLVYALISVVSATWRLRWIDRSGFFDGEPPGPAIYCVWHNRLASCMKAYYGYVRRRNRTCGMAAMVSASKDGGFLAGVLECFKVQPVRGSSSRRGSQALLELTTWAERGYDLALTPDGPRGPCYVVQDGITSLAQVTGLAILPVSFSPNWKIRAKSWDRFQIPLPFSRGDIIFGKPIRVARDASDEERETARRQLEQTLIEISKD